MSGEFKPSAPVADPSASAGTTDPSSRGIFSNLPNKIGVGLSALVIGVGVADAIGNNFGFEGVATADNAAPVPGEVVTNTLVSRGLSVNASSLASKKIIIGENDSIKETKQTIKPQNCIETKPGQAWTNSVKLINGKIYFYTETVAAELCRDSNSPTGWVKVGGGKTGLNCGNEAEPPSNHTLPPNNKIEVINVPNFNTSFTLVAKVALNKSVTCPGVSGSGSVFGEVDQKVNLSNYLKMTGAGQSKFDLTFDDQAQVKANLNLHCESSTTSTSYTVPETTPSTTTETVTTPATTTTTTTTPSPTPPSFVFKGTQEVDESTQTENSTDIIEVDESGAPAGDQLDVYFEAQDGEFSQAEVTATAEQGPVAIQDQYTAPDDAVTDPIIVKIVDPNTGLSATGSENITSQPGDPATGRP